MVSVTTDFGTEQGLAEFQCTDLQKVLPPWVDLSPADPLIPEVALPDVADPIRQVDEEGPALPLWATSFLLPHALSVPGMLHIVSNCLQDIHEHLDCWADIQSKLKVIESLLCFAPRRERFMELCVKRSSYKQHIHHFDRVFKRLYDQRWNAAINYVLQIMPVFKLLQACWDETKHKEGHSSQDGEDAVSSDSPFSASSLTNVLRDPALPFLMQMVVAIDGLAVNLGSWAEGCACHEELLTSCKSDHHRRRKLARLLRKDTDDVPVVGGMCKMQGKRAPELAAGRLQATIADMFEAAQAEFLLTIHGAATGELAVRAAVDFHSARSHIESTLQHKLAFWQRLPWRLCALALPSEEEGREHAQHCMVTFDATTTGALMEEHLTQHRLSQKFLSRTGSLRPLLERWVAGEALQSLPTLQREVNKLMLVPVVERVIESRGSHVRAAWSTPRHSGVTASLALRLAEEQRRWAVDRTHFLDFQQTWKEARRLSSVPFLVGLQDHPIVQELLSDPRRRSARSAWMTCLSRILYHADIDAQYLPRRAARLEHTTLQAKRTLARERAVQRLARQHEEDSSLG